MDRKIVVSLLVLITVAVIGISYSAMLNSQPSPTSTSTTHCKSESLAGNFTSSPEMNETSTGPYNVTFYIQNLGLQSVTITEYSDQNGLTQSVSWQVPAGITGSFQTMIDRTENSVVLKSSCGTFFTANVYYPNIPGSGLKHYTVMLYLSMGSAAK